MSYDASTNALKRRIQAESAQSEVLRLHAELAAARAEVEKLTRDRDGWERRTKELGSVVIRAWALLRDWWQYAQLEEREEGFADALARALAADLEHDKYGLAEIRRWRDECEKRNADLAAVRKAEEFARQGDCDIAWCNGGQVVASEFLDDGFGCVKTIAKAESFIALGRALAAQEGTDAT